MQRIADQVGISPYYLSHLFHKELKSDFTGYIFQLRMQYMMQLLQKKEYTVRELAEKLGYHDVGYFSRVVKKYTGKTVGEIKRSLKRINNNSNNVQKAQEVRIVNKGMECYAEITKIQ